MKKFLSILLAIILAFSAFTLVSFAEETEIANVSSEPTDAPANTRDSKYAKWIDEKINADDREFVIKELSRINGVDTEITAYVKDGKVAMKGEVDLEIFTLKCKFVVDVNSGKAKIYIFNLPFFYISVDDVSEIFGDYNALIYDYSDLDLVSVSKMQASGKEYYVEKFINNQNQVITKAFFSDDGTLVRTESIDATGYDTVITEFSYDVSDRDVNLPFYAFIDLAPLFTLLGVL